MKSFNAIIKSVKFNNTEWNCFTVSLELDMDRSGVYALGGTMLANLDPMDNLKSRNNYMGYFFSKIFEVVGVTDYKDIVGKPIRAVFRNNGALGDTCIGIQHFLDDGKFFIPHLTDEDDISGILSDDFLLAQYNSCKNYCLKRQNIKESFKENK